MDTAQNNLHWSALLAHHLPRTVVVSPGSRSTPLVLAYASMPGVEVHCILDERAAGFFALGLARASGKAVVLICTSGSAAAHYFPAVIEANLSGIPLVVLTADRPPELQHCGAPQTIDQVHLFGKHVRWFADMGTPNGETDPRWLRSIAAQALDHAEGALPGPVHINVPMREPLWTPQRMPPAAATPLQFMRGVLRLNTADISALAATLSCEPRGVFIAGGLSPTPGLAVALGELARRLGWPILAEPTSMLRNDTSDALRAHTVTSYDALLRGADFADGHAPSRVVRFGQGPTSKIIGQWVGRHAADRTWLVQPAGKLQDPQHAASAVLVADPEQLVLDLLPHVGQTADTAWLRAWQKAEHRARHVLDSACAQGFWEAAVAHEVHSQLPKHGALHVASSMPIRDLDSFVPAKDIAIFANRGANGIDGTLACALGTAAAWKRGPTVLLVGDLAFLHDVGSLQLAQQIDVRLTIVVVNNGGGGIFDFLPIAEHPEHFQRFFRTPQAADLQALSRAAGAHASQVNSRDELGHALEASWQQAGLSVIEAVMPAPQNNVARHRQTWAAVAEAVARA